jgi:hypothetical protein
MATVNKDFKIKSGLIVEGTTGTINGQDILTTSQASTDHIVSIVGGTTLVTSVESTQLEVINGELNVKSGVFDVSGAAAAAETAANQYTNGEITTALTTAQGYANTAEDNAAGYTNSAISTEVTDRNSAISSAISTEVTDRNSAINSAISTEVTNRNSAIATAKGEAITAAEGYTDGEITTALTTAQGYATTAEGNANDYTDTAISGEVTNRNSAISTAITNLNLSGTYDALGAAADALVDAKAYTDQEVAALVDGAPALLDTLNELAAAIADNPNYATDVANLVASKADTTYVNSEISDLNTAAQGYATTAQNNAATDATTKADAAQAAAVATASADATSKANAAQAAAEATASADATTKANAARAAAEATASADATSKANAAETAAKSYADGLASNYDAAGSASSAQTAAETFATNAINALDTDAIEEGSVNQYFLDSRAKTSAADLLTGASLTNITITGTGAGLTITAENGVADSTTDDLEEGSTNLYFTDSRAVSALEAVVPNFVAVELNAVAKQVASTLSAPTAGIQVGHAFAKADYRSAEFLVKVAYGTHTEISKVLLTLDTSDNIAITEYGIVGTNGSASSVSADISGDNVQLLVTTANNNSTVTVMGTLLA